MPAQKMTDKQWYKIFNDLSARLDAASGSQATKFLRWSADPRGKIPDPENVDALQEALSRHMDLAPDDEPEDETAATLRAKRFVQEHFDSIGETSGYALPLRHTQTKEFHDSLADRKSDFMLDGSRAVRRHMATALTPVLPRRDNPASYATATESCVEDGMATAFEAFKEAHPESDLSEEDFECARILCGMSSGPAQADGAGNGADRT